MEGAAPGQLHEGAPVRRHGALGVWALVYAAVVLVGTFVPLLNGYTFWNGLLSVAVSAVALAHRGSSRLLPAIALPLSIFVMGLGLVIPSSSPVGEPAAAPLPGETRSPVPAGTPLPVATQSPTPEPVLGSVPSHPAPAGSALELAEYRVQFGEVMLDATDAVLASGSGAPPPEPGHQYAMVPVTLTYFGDSTGLPLAEVRVLYLAADGSTYSSAAFDEVTPEPRFGAVTLQPGESATGNILVELPSDAVDSGVWVVRTLEGAAVHFTAD